MSHSVLRTFCTTLALSALPVAAGHAQDGRIVPPGWTVGHVKVESSTGRRTAGHLSRDHRVVADERGLTIRRRSEPVPDEDDTLFSGGTHYNDIRLFDPVPSIDSGTQFPYGLDGIGGFGSDLGFNAAEDSHVYDRGQ